MPPVPSTTAGPTVPVPTYVDEDGFNDHTVPAITSALEFFALARAGVAGQSVVKFTISDLGSVPRISWMDSNFYSLHDEWYWYRLLNGASVAGSGEAPVRGPRFATVAEIYEWAAAQPPAALPLDLRFVGGQATGNRLYSDRFYDLALQEPRVFGLGSLAFFPTSAGEGGLRWVIELEYQDDPAPDEIAAFFTTIAASTPVEIGDNLEWVVRSPQQAAVARAMVAGAMPFSDRIITYSELVEPGTVAVYNEGIAAGRLLLIGEGGRDISTAGENDILLVENVPDFLPPGRALISSAPQTPLAHVNLLARNRGIPNASQAGILQDPAVQQAARVRAHALVRASVSSGLEIVLISPEEYEAWLDLNTTPLVAVPRVDYGSIKNLVDLAAIDVDDEAGIGAWRPVIGGKSAGFINLIAADGVSLPPDPLAITVRPYFEHLAKFDGILDALLSHSAFGDPAPAGSARTRFLFLEGPDAYAGFYSGDADRAHAAAIQSSHPPGTALGDILSAGGFKRFIRSAPMDATTLQDVTAGLKRSYGGYVLSQGLRFRSSSTVEDIEGFNGAGLYESSTGFLRPELQVDADDHHQTIEWALKRTWASYWGFEAFEERRRAGIDHRSGGMAVLVHARFDDPLELGNGVFTYTIMPGDAITMTLNAQAGDVSVTNPDPELAARPEVVVVRRAPGELPVIIRTADSSLVPPGDQVLADDQVLELFTQAGEVAVLWRRRINAVLPAAQRIATLTLDFEFKEMAAGWPALPGGQEAYPERLVLKQARTLEPGLHNVPPAVRALPIPRDVLSRARLVEETSCPAVNGGAQVTVAVLTDPLLAPDVGYAESPLIVAIEPGRVAADAPCTTTTLYSTPDQFLFELLERGEILNLSQ